MRARTRRWQAVFILGLEEGVFPRRSTETPFLPDETRRELEAGGKGRRLVRPDPARARALPLLHGVHARLAPARPRSRGRRRRRSSARAEPFYEEVRSRFDPADVALATKKRPLSSLSWELERGPTERERLRAAAAIASTDEDEARALALANGWERRIERALSAFDRQTTLAHPLVVEELAERARFSVTELETLPRLLLDVVLRARHRPEGDRRRSSTRAFAAESRTRRSTASTAACRSGSATDAVEAEPPRRGARLPARMPRRGDRRRVRWSSPTWSGSSSQGTLGRDLEHFVRQELELGLPLVPRRFEVVVRHELGAGRAAARASSSAASPCPGRSTGSTSTRSAPAASSRTTSSARRARRPRDRHGARSSRSRSTCSRFATSSGMEPLGGLYRGLDGDERGARAHARRGRATSRPGLKRPDYLAEDEFWRQVDEAQARARAGRRPHARRRRAARPARRRVPALVRPLDDVPGEARMSDDVQSRAAGRGDRRAGRRLRLGRRRDREDDGAGRALRARPSASAGSARERPRHHLHRARGRRAAHPDPRAAAWRLERHDLARDLDGAWISTIHGFCHRLLRAIRSRPGSTRASACSTRARRACCARRRSPRRSPRLRRDREPERVSRCWRPTAPTGSASCSPASTSACARPGGRSSCAGRAVSAARRARWPSSREVRRVHARAVTEETLAAAPSGGRARSSSIPSACRRAARPVRPASCAGRGARAVRVVRRGARRRSSRRRSTRSPPATGRSSRSCSARFDAAYREAKARESALDFEDLQLLARDLLRLNDEGRATTRAGASARSSWTSSRTRTGSSASWSTSSRARSSSSSATSSSRSTASATRTSRSSASGGQRVRACSR